jgi:hypothetical protein
MGNDRKYIMRNSISLQWRKIIPNETLDFKVPFKILWRRGFDNKCFSYICTRARLDVTRTRVLFDFKNVPYSLNLEINDKDSSVWVLRR